MGAAGGAGGGGGGAGGGTGGHIEPALNLADELRRRDPDTAITVIGTAKAFCLKRRRP